MPRNPGKKGSFLRKFSSFGSSSISEESEPNTTEWTPPTSQSKSPQVTEVEVSEEKILSSPEHGATWRPKNPTSTVAVPISVQSWADESLVSLHSATLPIIKCNKCGNEATRQITRSGNRNGNAGKPFYKCFPCKNFVCWEGNMGIHKNNPLCDCGRISRFGLANADKGRKIFFKCASGTCDFFDWELDEGGNKVGVDEKMAKMMLKLGIA